jgi:hopene-associated glycosyltransferase HpnB
MLGLSIACVLAAVAWAYLFAGHGGFWRTTERLPTVTRDPASWPDVVAVVPARNEAEMLPVTLPTLLGQDYPGALSVILVDDCSSDGTAEVAAHIARASARPLRVIPGAPPSRGSGPSPGSSPACGSGSPPGAPPSRGSAPSPASGSGPASAPSQGTSPSGDGTGAAWAGKVWAMAQGLGAAGIPSAEPAGPGYVLFTDADIAWGAGALRGLVGAAEGDDRDLLSQMALLRTATPWERIVVPAFVYFFAQLYPFRRVNVPGSRTAAAAGGCMLVRREALHRSGGLAPISGALIDDVALGRMIKRQGGRCWLGLSTQVVSVRPYPRLAHLWQMVARSAYTQLSYSPPLLLATVIGLLFLYALPPAGAIAGLAGLAAGAATGPAALAAGAGLAGWALMALTYLPMLRLYRLSPLRAPGLPLIALLYAAMTVDSARRHYAGRGGEWKGRTTGSRLRWLSGSYLIRRPLAGWQLFRRSAVVRRAAGRPLAPLSRRRRVHRQPAAGEPARRVPRRARPGRRPDAAHGPGTEPVGDRVLPAVRAGLRRPGQDLHPGR